MSVCLSVFLSLPLFLSPKKKNQNIFLGEDLKKKKTPQGRQFKQNKNLSLLPFQADNSHVNIQWVITSSVDEVMQMGIFLRKILLIYF